MAGLAAKPIIDMTVVVAGRGDVPLTIERLATLGYCHRGNLGIEDREAFDHRPGLCPGTICMCARKAPSGWSINSPFATISVRIQTPRVSMASLKKHLAGLFPDDIDSYVFGKTDFILGVLRRAGLTEEQLASIERVNRRC